MYLQPKYQVCFLYYEGTIPTCMTAPLEWSGSGAPGPEAVKTIPPGAYGFYFLRVYETTAMTPEGEKVLQHIAEVQSDETSSDEVLTVEYIIGCAYTRAQLTELDSTVSQQILSYFGDSISTIDMQEYLAIQTSMGAWIAFEESYVVLSPFEFMAEL